MKTYVLGQVTKSCIAHYSSSLEVFVIHFTSAGMHRLFGIPMHEFTNWTIDFESILRPDEKCLVDKVFEAPTHEQRVTIVEELLIRRLSQKPPPLLDRIQYASNMILHKNGAILVRELASDVNMSERNFERHFIEKVGVPPKTFSGIARIKSVMQMIEKMPKLSWKDIPYSLQYTDQAHFIHEFKRFAGKTPSEYYKSTTDFEHFLYGE